MLFTRNKTTRLSPGQAAADRSLSAANVRGGLLAWQDAGLPVDTGREPTRSSREGDR